MVFRYETTCFKCVIISRTDYSFPSKRSLMSVRKTAGFMSLNRISEQVWDSESYELGAPSSNSSENDGVFF